MTDAADFKGLQRGLLEVYFSGTRSYVDMN